MKTRLFSAIFVVSLMAFLSSCNGGIHQQTFISPRIVVEKFITSMKKGAFNETWKCLSRATQEKKGLNLFINEMQSILKDENCRKELDGTLVMFETVKGDTAKVTVRYPMMGREDNFRRRDIRLIKEDGGWKIDMIHRSETIRE